MDLSRWWACDRALTPVEVGALVGAAFPQLAPARATFLGEGWDCQVFLVNEAHAVRLPKRAAIGPLLVEERALTRAIAPRLPVRIPEIRWAGEPGATFPWAWNGHPLIPGVPARRVSLAPAAQRRIGAAIGQFLAALHVLPTGGLRDRRALADDLPRFRTFTRELFADLAPSFSAERRDRAIAFLDAAPPAPSTRAPVFLHGELTGENVILDLETRGIGGVVDWTDARLGDPAADFAGMFQSFGEELLLGALDAYPDADQALAERARYIGRCGAFLRLAHALDGGEGDRMSTAWAAIDRL